MTAMAASPGGLLLFVYGTLKRGFAAHDRFCRKARFLGEAVVWGRLYHLPEGYPALEIPESAVIACGSADLAADAALQTCVGPPAFVRPEGDWDLVCGELFAFSDPAAAIPPIDRFEDFCPDPGPAPDHSLYLRALVPVRRGDETLAAWMYVTPPPPGGERIRSGRWQG